MARNERHREQVRLASQARNEAMRILRDRHEAEFQALYEERARALGVEPRRARLRDRALADLASLGLEVEIRPAQQ